MWGKFGRVSGQGVEGKVNKKDNTRQEREKQRNRQGETEVTRSKLMHGQLSESRRQRKRLFLSMNKCDIMGHRTKFTDTVERWKI